MVKTRNWKNNMTFTVHPETFKNLINQAKFSTHGDKQERKYGNLITKKFPNYEYFWQIFVVPLTQRILVDDRVLGQDIDFRDGIDDELMHIASIHYSLFMHLIFAHQHIENQGPSWFEDFYTHLGTVCDLAESVLERWHLLRLRCQGEQSKILATLSRDEFLSLAGEAYDKDYENAYEHYLSKGKFMAIKVPQGSNLVKEYFGKKSEERKDFVRTSQKIRTYRNIMVHDIKLARVNDNEKIFIPNLDKVSKYRSWRKVEEATKNDDIFGKDFMEQIEHVTSALENLEKSLNALWSKLIQDVKEEWFSTNRDVLRQFAGINFSEDSGIKVIVNPTEDIPYDGTSGTYPPPSGVVLKGS